MAAQDAPQLSPALPDVVSLLMDGNGGSQSVELTTAPVQTGFHWVHLRRDAPAAEMFLASAGLDPHIVDALTADDTRPRCTVHGDGVLLNLRGVNLIEGAAPEDMVSIRLWIEAHRVVGVWRRPLVSVVDLLAAIERGHAPQTPGDLVARLALRLVDRAEPAVSDLSGMLDDIEEAMLDHAPSLPRRKLAEMRRQAMILRRYMLPQRDALTTLEIEDLDWLSDHDRSRLREAAERVFRLGEELDAIRDRAQLVHDQLMDQRAELMNQRMLVLSVVAAIFLPLGLVAGLLGMNVGGLPGTQSPWAFWSVCAGLTGLGVVLWLWFRRNGMMR